MKGLQLPSLRMAVRTPAVRTAAVLVVAAPVYVAWLGKDSAAPTRLRVVGFVLGAVLAMAWEDRGAAVTAATPVGLPAVRHGRAAVVLLLLGSAWVLSALVSGGGSHLLAVTLQSGTVAVLLVAIVGWLARDREGESVAALPVPVLFGLLVVIQLLPERVALMRSAPGTETWGPERTRWWVLLGVSLEVVALLDRDPYRRRSLRRTRLSTAT